MDEKRKAIINFLNIVCDVPISEIRDVRDEGKFISVDYMDGTRSNIISVTDKILTLLSMIIPQNEET